MSDDLSGIRHALALARDRGFAEVAVESGELKFRATLTKGAARPKPPVDAVGPIIEDSLPDHQTIRSQLVGFYRPSESPLAVGNMVQVGDVIGVVSSLGDIPYAIESSVEGEIVEVCVEANQPVEYGQIIAKVKA